ncbi:unnamed protein product [Clonostachys rosea f. rosea IK726]|uniref:Transcription factor domain-containing protein n=2 Tax=Bionectria ochroleuca TaxID=29856 RepID=A0A0B7KJS3_BIOOC|nr:unnamed protein product [Clonostachys rosea f. rosea IK726]
MTVTVPSSRASLRRGSKVRFINTTAKDVELYRHLAYLTLQQPHFLVRPTPSLLRRPQFVVRNMDLVHYFHADAHLSLVAFSPNTADIRDALIRMAFASDTDAGRALLYALLAVSALRRSGFHEETLQFKVAALHALSKSSGVASLGTTESVQHVAACMLLGAFEILLPSDSSGEWIWYIRGAMDIIRETQLTMVGTEADINILLDWTYYHYSLSTFTISHWRNKAVILDSSPNPTICEPVGGQDTLVAIDKQLFRSPNPTHEILNLLAEACDTLLSRSDPRSQEDSYKQQLKQLEHRIESIPVTPDMATDGAELSGLIKLYKLSTLIYVIRAGQTTWEATTRLDNLVNRAFQVPIGQPGCYHFFPLFIVACEARTDEQRAAVLDLIARTERNSFMRSMKMLKAGIEAIWVQRDLHADEDLLMNYMDLMNVVISSNSTLPSFV